MLNSFKYFRKVLISPSIRCLTTEADIEERLFQKGPLDPQAAELFKKHESSILFSSYVENNKRPLSYRHRVILRSIAEKHKTRLRLYGTSKPFSLALKFIDKKRLHDSHASELIAEKIKEGNDEQHGVKNELKTPDADREFNPISRKILLSESKLEILREMKKRRKEFEEPEEPPKYPAKWMQDYETYDESNNSETDDDISADVEFGTPDPSVPISKIPCYGCGAMLHCVNHTLPGYLPSELFLNQDEAALRQVTCQRCHFLKNYNTALKLKVDAEEYVKMISSISNKKALAVLMVDLVDFPCSIWPGIVDILGPHRPIIVVGNKVDLLPQDSKKYLDHIKSCLEASLINAGFTKTNIKHIGLISAETNFGIEDLITNIHRFWGTKGDCYLIGCTNVGKSTLFNALIKSDLCKSKASNIIKRVTASIWPGTTLRMLKFPIMRPSHARLFERERRLHDENRKIREQRKLQKSQVNTGENQDTTLIGHIGQTFTARREEESGSYIHSGEPHPTLFIDERKHEYKESHWFFDTPGVVQPDQIINFLTIEELLDVVPKQALWPRVFLIKPSQTLFLAGLGRIDYVSGAEKIRLAVFASHKLPILIVKTEDAETVYNDCLGSELLKVPRGGPERYAQFPKLKRSEEAIKVTGYDAEHKSECDILLSSTGWVSVNLPQSEIAKFHVWTPDARGIYVRRPALLPYAAMEYRGIRKRKTLTYNMRIPKRVTF